MYNYSNKKNRSKYIVGYSENNQDTLTLRFGDGRSFNDVVNSEENKTKIKNNMEKEIHEAIKYLPRYLTLARLSVCNLIMAETCAFFGTNYISGLAGLSDEARYAATGAVCLTSSIPLTLYCIKSYAKVRELEKVQYRDEHIPELLQTTSYNHSLDGVSKKLGEHIKNNSNPFGIEYVDMYTKKDLESIINEMEREDYQIKEKGLVLVKK